MIDFHCPSCKGSIQAPDEFAGKNVACPTCQLSAAVPARALDSITTEPARPTWNPTLDAPGEQPSIVIWDRIFWLRFTVWSAIALSVFTVAVVLVMGGLPKVRTSATRTQTINNLKQIGVTFHSHHDTLKRLPFNGSDRSIVGWHYSAAAKPNDSNSGSWAFQIQPFIDSNKRFATLDKAEPVQCFLDPARNRPPFEAGGGAWSDYFYNNYLNDPEQASKPNAPDLRRTMVGITDGTSNTVFVGQGNISTEHYTRDRNVVLSTNMYQGGTNGTMRAGDNGKTSPTGVTLARDSAALPGVGSWGGPYSQGAFMVMGNGVVKMFPYTTVNFGAFLTPTGGENVVLPD